MSLLNKISKYFVFLLSPTSFPQYYTKDPQNYIYGMSKRPGQDLPCSNSPSHPASWPARLVDLSCSRITLGAPCADRAQGTTEHIMAGSTPASCLPLTISANAVVYISLV